MSQIAANTDTTPHTSATSDITALPAFSVKESAISLYMRFRAALKIGRCTCFILSSFFVLYMVLFLQTSSAGGRFLGMLLNYYVLHMVPGLMYRPLVRLMNSESSNQFAGACCS